MTKTDDQGGTSKVVFKDRAIKMTQKNMLKEIDRM